MSKVSLERRARTHKSTRVKGHLNSAEECTYGHKGFRAQEILIIRLYWLSRRAGATKIRISPT